MSGLEHRVFKLVFRGKRYPLANVFRAAEVPGRVFDEWYERVRSELDVGEMSKTKFQCLLGYLDGDVRVQEAVRRNKKNAAEVVSLSVEWEAGGMVEWFGVVQSRDIVGAIVGFGEVGVCGKELEGALRRYIEAGEFEAVSGCPVEVVLRASSGLGSVWRVGLAKAMGDFGWLFLEGVDFIIRYRGGQRQDFDTHMLPEVYSDNKVITCFDISQSSQFETQNMQNKLCWALPKHTCASFMSKKRIAKGYRRVQVTKIQISSGK